MRQPGGLYEAATSPCVTSAYTYASPCDDDANLQIGWRFWDLLQQEHAAVRNDDGTPTARRLLARQCRSHRVYEATLARTLQNPTDSTSLLTFFQPTKDRNVPSDARFSSRYRARAVLLDMEEGVVSQLLRSPIGPMFDTHMRLTDVSGAGNNWACGYAEYGPRYRDGAMDMVRRSLEACDSPQAFLMLHSLGGGTGSGFGSYVLEQLHDNFPELYRFNAPLLPSKNDDVITSPYNALLATARLIEHADAVLPVDNQCLMDIVAAVGKQKKTGDAATRSGPSLLDLDYKEKGKPLAPASSASGVRHTSRAATSTASSSAAGAMAPLSATVSAQASQLPSALASMLEQADAVLDAVSHGLGAQQPVTSSTAPSSSSAIKSGVRRVGSATTSASGVAGVRPAVGVAGSTAAGAGSRSTATGSGVRRVAGTTAAAAPGRSSIASAGNNVAAAVVGSGPRAALPAASSGSRAASGLSKGQATLPAPAKPATPGRVAQPDNRAAPRQPALLPQQQRPAAPAASHAAPFALHEEEKDGGDGEGGDAEEHDDSDALINGPNSGNGAGGGSGRRKGTAYDAMNNLVGHMVSNTLALDEHLHFEMKAVPLALSQPNAARLWPASFHPSSYTHSIPTHTRTNAAVEPNRVHAVPRPAERGHQRDHIYAGAATQASLLQHQPHAAGWRNWGDGWRQQWTRPAGRQQGV